MISEFESRTCVVSYEEGAGFLAGKKFDSLVISVQPCRPALALDTSTSGIGPIGFLRVPDHGEEFRTCVFLCKTALLEIDSDVQGKNPPLIAMTTASGQTFLYHRLAASFEKAQYNTNDHAKENQLCQKAQSRILCWRSYIRSRSFWLLFDFIPQRHVQLVAWHRRKSRSDEFFTDTHQQFQSITSDGR